MENSLPNIEQAILSIAGALGSPERSSQTVDLPSTVTFNAASTAWQDSGWDITLPKAGIWLVFVDVRYLLTGAIGRYIQMRLYNETQAVDITNTQRLIDYRDSTNAKQGTHGYSFIVTTTDDDEIIRVEGKVSASVTDFRFLKDANGQSQMHAVHLRRNSDL